MPNLDFILRFENSEATDDEVITEFQKMINSGVVWQLQGFYGRTAKSLIDDGYCHL